MTFKKKYVLQDLLNVRKLREDAAAKEWGRQKEVVAAAEVELAQRRKELEEYKTWRVQRENELFEEILDQTIQFKDLEDLRFRIQKLRDDESNYESRLIEAEERLRNEQQKLEEAREHYYEAYRQRDKLDEHKAMWVREAAKEQEVWEEKEMEDFKTRMQLLVADGA